MIHPCSLLLEVAGAAQKCDSSELSNLTRKGRVLRAMGKIQLTEMTENNLLSAAIRQLGAFIAFKKEITYFFPLLSNDTGVYFSASSYKST